jgi:hypothetical protein
MIIDRLTLVPEPAMVIAEAVPEMGLKDFRAADHGSLTTDH